VAFTVAVMALMTLTQVLKFSPVLAALSFGLMARHRRIVLSQAQRNFGSLGDLLTVLLFVFVTATLEWRQVVSGLGLGLAVILARLLVKTLAVVAFARFSGISWRKGMLTGLSLAPMAVCAILLMEQTRHVGADLFQDMAAMASVVLVLEVVGPILTQRALIWAGESFHERA
jgi:Kef-type K+ transport system membrane component KefB